MRFLQVSLLLLLSTNLVVAVEKTKPANSKVDQRQLHFFEKEVRPLLIKHCLECHGDKKQKGELRLDSLKAMLTGGESGPSIVPGKSHESLLVEAINYESYEMPPDEKLSDKEIATLTRWVDTGAYWPENADYVIKQRKMETFFTEEDRNFWVFQPVKQTDVPEVKAQDWSKNPIDAFIFNRLKKEGLKPAGEASRTTLIRRAYYDLIGLPPTVEQINAFVNDPSPDAWPRLIEELLESPHYGEKWARHWLDVVRYAESDGFNQDAFRPEIWRYRDYVVRSFNSDKPYSQFVKEQLAGDEIAPEDPEALAATGFLRHYLYEYNQRDARTQWNDILDNITDATGDVFMGMSMGCARCHDHKFDPISHQDYYRLQAFFAPMMPRDDVPFVTPRELAEYNQKLDLWEKKTADIRAQIDEVTKKSLEGATRSQIKMFPADIQEIMEKPEAERTAHEHQLADLVNRQVDIKQRSSLASLKKSDKPNGKKYKELLKQLAAFDDLKPKPLPTGMSVTDSKGATPITTIPDDPNHTPIVPGFLSLLKPGEAEIVPISTAPHSTGRRTALANWMVNPQNRLTTRVITNRVWQYHFGTGLVATANDFGHMGEAPSHPALLDWLTAYFVENGWSIKNLHRLIMNSSTYRLSAFHPAPQPAELKDPTNRLHWRANIRRLDAEDIRDSALFLSGELDTKLGGPSVSANQPRRSIYTIMKRNVQDPVLGAFDLPGGIKSVAQRDVTTTANQALLMINGDWFLKRASAMARNVKSEPFNSEEELISHLHQMAFGKKPEPAEIKLFSEFLNTQEKRIAAEADSHKQTFIGQITQNTGDAIKLGKGSKLASLSVGPAKSLPAVDLTIEAVVQLDSIYENASVNTIAAHWTGNSKQQGWSFGVTSQKSAYKPRNLILQLVGDNKQGKLTYEVVASNLHLELHKPYYVAAAINIADTSEQGITFYVKELFSDKPLQTVSVKHSVVGNYRPDYNFVLGGREKTSGSRWTGLLDNVRLSKAALTSEQLLINQPEKQSDATVGFWQFNDENSLLKNQVAGDLKILPPSETSLGASNARQQALVDLCHVLLNSNEFLYLD
ncbi:Planctomycete cytochrome C [Gimesia maris]|uniref:DUF1549 domain-containing protein n=1 Tax=Gimesia maris TaxID=122 RepID=UPI0011889B37|nr:DUF1549 domain-containing protein [Gimesia maris]QDT77370.1 Planctomycete cytochrome C [Gimesia maris]